MWNKIEILLKQVLRHTYNNKSISLHEYRLIEQWLKQYLETFLKRLRNNGKVWTLGRYKGINHIAKCIASNTPFEPLNWAKSKDSIPKELNLIKGLLQGSNPVVKRIILTVTRIFESIYLTPELEIDSVCKPYSGTINLSKFKFSLEDFIKSMGRERLPSLRLFKPLDKLRSRANSGPNGPSISSAHIDCMYYMNDTYSNDLLIKFNQLIGQSWINETFEFCKGTYKTNKSIEHGTIGLSSEPGGKTRLFTIGDYWRQNAMLPIHDYLMLCLKHNSHTDATFDQKAGFARLLKVRSKGMWSFDLSKASDRIPAYLQYVLIKQIFRNKELALTWWRLMTNTGFLHRKTKVKVKWEVGQPLGLLSSWPAFSLLHHYLVWYCAKEAGLDPKGFNQYLILGDDIVIWNESVALRYEKLLSELGVDINRSKSFISAEYNNSFEFAKRQAVKGQEITGISFVILRNATKSIYNLIDLYKYMIESNWELNLGISLVPSYLSQSGKNLFEILLWEMSGTECPPSYIDFGITIIPTLSQLRSKLRELRIKSLFALIEQLDKIFDVPEISESFTKGGIDWQPRLFSSNTLHHPIVWALNQQGEDLYRVLGLTMEADPNEPSTWPELDEVEYMPLPTRSLYFKPKRGNPIFRKKHSKFVLEALYKSTSE